MAQAQHQQLLAMNGAAHLEGEALKVFALEKLRKGEMPDREMTEQMMARLLPADQGEVGYCVEVMTIAALRLKNSPGGQTLLAQLPELLPEEAGASKIDLCLLGGFVYGLLAEHCAASPEWLSKLREHLQGYLEQVIQMSTENCHRLAALISSTLSTLSQAEE
jgi:hypothetical protein